jgi:hypothetical protein
MRVRLADERIADSEDVEAGATVIDSRISVRTVAGDVAPHPTLSEAIKGAVPVARPVGRSPESGMAASISVCHRSVGRRGRDGLSPGNGILRK